MKTDTENTLPIPKAEPLARKFAECVLRNVGQENHAELLERTKAILAAGSSVCASHDYCDANESMLEAWNALGGSEPFCDMGSDEANEAARDLECTAMNAAWTMAKRNLFWLI